jgi:phytanoyl-CoA hydroxylase
MVHTETTYPVCPEILNQAELERYDREGFLVYEAALTSDEVAEANGELSGIVADYVNHREEWTRAADHTPHQESTNVKRNDSRLMFQVEAGVDISGKSAKEIELCLRKYMWFHAAAPIFRRIYTNHQRIQGVVRSILGDDVSLYQSMALTKPPRIGIDKPWHQDNAYFSVQNPSAILGSWIALDDSTVKNGCMHFIPGGHHAGPLKHHHTHDCEIVADRFDASKAVAVEIPAGSIIFFSGNIPHYTPPNHSDKRRRALQYHYRASSNQIIPAREYDEIFTEKDGSPASCSSARRGGF